MNTQGHGAEKAVTSLGACALGDSKSLDLWLLHVDHLGGWIQRPVYAHFLSFKLLHFILMVNVIGRARGRFLEYIFAALLHHGSDKLFAAAGIGLLRLILRRLSLIGSLLVRLLLRPCRRLLAIRRLRLRRRRLAVRRLLRLLGLRRLLWGLVILRVQQTSPGENRHDYREYGDEGKRFSPFSHKILQRRCARVPITEANRMPKSCCFLTHGTIRHCTLFHLNKLGIGLSGSHRASFSDFSVRNTVKAVADRVDLLEDAADVVGRICSHVNIWRGRHPALEPYLVCAYWSAPMKCNDT